MENENELIANYLELREIVEQGIEKAQSLENPREAKKILIEVQQHFKGLKLYHEDRELLYGKVQKEFEIVNGKIEAENSLFEKESESNYMLLKSRSEHALGMFTTGADTRDIWNQLIEIQADIKTLKLKKEDRYELIEKIQEGFTLIKMERDEQQRKFQTESQLNYQRLKKLVDEGLTLAEETHEYKETREFLKKIQNEFKGIKLLHEQREELYSRLQTAFDILGKRLDDFFHNKKKNWETRMNFTLSRFDAENFQIEQSLQREYQYLEELKDQLEILESSGKDTTAILSLKARIISVSDSIEVKKTQILKNQTERDELKSRLDQ